MSLTHSQTFHIHVSCMVRPVRMLQASLSLFHMPQACFACEHLTRAYGAMWQSRDKVRLLAKTHLPYASTCRLCVATRVPRPQAKMQTFSRTMHNMAYCHLTRPSLLPDIARTTRTWLTATGFNAQKLRSCHSHGFTFINCVNCHFGLSLSN